MSYYQTGHDAVRDIMNETQMLRSVAQSMLSLGLDSGANNLIIVADEIEQSAYEIKDALSNLLAEYVKQTEESTSNMLSAAIAVATKELPPGDEPRG